MTPTKTLFTESKLGKSSIFLMVFIIILGLPGCNRRCEDFNYNVVQWLPYEINEQIQLKTSQSVESFLVTSNEIHHTEKIPRLASCLCVNSLSVSLESDTVDIFIHIHDAKDISSGMVSINDEHLDFKEYVNSYNLNDEVFSEVIVFEGYSQVKEIIYEKVVIAKHIGIIQIVSSDEEWYINDNQIKPTDALRIEVIEEEC